MEGKKGKEVVSNAREALLLIIILYMGLLTSTLHAYFMCT